jgi:hypothetical protein
LMLAGMSTTLSMLERQPVTKPGNRGASQSQIQVFVKINNNNPPMMIKS